MSSKKPLGTGGKNRAHSPTAIRTMRAQARRREIHKLRIAGYSIRDLAKKFGIATSTAHDDVVQISREAYPQQEAEELARLQMARYDEELKVWWPKMQTGDATATTICLKIQHEQNLLASLYPDTGKVSPLFLQAGNGKIMHEVKVSFVQPEYETPLLEPPGKIIEGRAISGSPPEPPREPPPLGQSAAEPAEPSRPHEQPLHGVVKPEVSLRKEPSVCAPRPQTRAEIEGWNGRAHPKPLHWMAR